MNKFVVLLSLVAVTSATELTDDNFDEKTAGKTVFIKFLAPWCGHCKSMKPAWDKLMAKFADKPGVLVADVDCTSEGKQTCENHEVQGFPTIKWGDPSALEDYEGGRDFDSLSKFAEENLKPLCSPSNIDLCDDEKKKKISELQAMDPAALEKMIEEKTGEMAKAEKTFEEEVEKLQKKYEELEKEKTEKVAAIKASGLSLMKAVQAAAKPNAEL